MGSYNRHKFEANTYDQKVIAAVLEVITKEYEAPDCFGKWGDYDKWYGAGDMALGLSKKFPKVMFSLQRAGLLLIPKRLRSHIAGHIISVAVTFIYLGEIVNIL